MKKEHTGQKIRNMRKEKNMSIKDLAEKSQLSTGLISQIERDLVSPSINAMTKIVKALDSTMGVFFDEDFIKENPVTITRKQRKKLLTRDKDRIYELLCPTDNRLIELILVRIQKSDGKNIAYSTHEGEECGFVIRGKMSVIIDGEEFELSEGDSFYFESTKPHKYVNYHDEECLSIWAMTPPSF